MVCPFAWRLGAAPIWVSSEENGLFGLGRKVGRFAGTGKNVNNRADRIKRRNDAQNGPRHGL